MLYMASTKVSPEKTASEIMALLAKYGAKHIMTTYKNGEIIGLDFVLEYKGRKIPFRLPVRWEPVLKAMEEDRSTPKYLCTPDQARRVAWRQILRWLQAQLALVEVGMVDVKEIFLPYTLVEKDRTLYERLVCSDFKQIGYEERGD